MQTLRALADSYPPERSKTNLTRLANWLPRLKKIPQNEELCQLSMRLFPSIFSFLFHPFYDLTLARINAILTKKQLTVLYPRRRARLVNPPNYSIFPSFLILPLRRFLSISRLRSRCDTLRRLLHSAGNASFGGGVVSFWVSRRRERESERVSRLRGDASKAVSSAVQAAAQCFVVEGELVTAHLHVYDNYYIQHSGEILYQLFWFWFYVNLTACAYTTKDASSNGLYLSVTAGLYDMCEGDTWN